MKLGIFLLVTLTILKTLVKCNHIESPPNDVISLSRAGELQGPDVQSHGIPNIAAKLKEDQAIRVKRKVFGKIITPIRKLGSKVATGIKRRVKGIGSILKPIIKFKKPITKVNQQMSGLLSKVKLPKQHPALSKLQSKFADLVKRAVTGSAQARSTLKSSLSTLLEFGNAGASLGVSIAQILALTKPQGTGAVVIASPEKDDLTPLLLEVLKLSAPNRGSGSGVLHSSVLVSVLAVIVTNLFSHRH